MMKYIYSIAFFLACSIGFAVEKKEERPVPALNTISETSLSTPYSNLSDADISTKTSLYLSDYDKKNNLAILQATGDREKKGSPDYIPYIKEKCDGGSCGIAPAGAPLAAVTIDKAKEALKQKKSASSIDKAAFKDGSVWIVQSEAPDKSGKKWAVTLAVELQKLAKNTKSIVVKYKVLEFAAK